MKFFQLIVTFFLLVLASVDAQSLKCPIRAQSAILYNPGNGAILFEKGSDEPRYPASIIKIATALFVLDEKKLDLKIECLVSKEAIRKMNADTKHADPLSYPAYILEHDGRSLGLKSGNTYSLERLLHGMLLFSANDCANVIAENCSGTIEAFMEELNEYLKQKGLRQTQLQNPHGLYHPAQITTAYDMAQIAALAFQNPLFCNIIKSASYKDENLPHPILNMNSLVKEGKYQYPKILGGKIGYTASSGSNLVAAAQDEGRKLIAVILGCSSSDDMYIDAITLFETAFREKSEKRLLFTKGDHRFPKAIKGAKELYATIKEDIEISYFPSEERPINTELIWDSLVLPIYSGAEVGKLVVEDGNGHTYTTAPLYAANTIRKMPLKRRGIKYFFVALIMVLCLAQFLKERTKIFKR